jgi:hypothetical protein
MSGRRQIHRAGPGDVLEHARNVIAGGAEDLLGVIEDDVDAAPLLEHREHHAEHKHLAHLRLQQVREAHPLDFFACQRGLDVGDRRIRIGLAANFGQDAARALGFTVFCQPTRAFRHEQHAHEKQQ